MISHTEAKDEARRLTKVSGREVEVTSINCECDYNAKCGTCAGQGYSYSLIYGLCNHAVRDDDRDEVECLEQRCSERESALRGIELPSTFQSHPVESCFEIQSTRDEEMEYAK